MKAETQYEHAMELLLGRTWRQDNLAAVERDAIGILQDKWKQQDSYSGKRVVAEW